MVENVAPYSMLNVNLVHKPGIAKRWGAGIDLMTVPSETLGQPMRWNLYAESWILVVGYR